MARGRLISRTLGSSRKFAALHQVAGHLAEFAQSLYPLLVACSDDHGRQSGDAFTVRCAVFPSSPRTESEFEAALVAMAGVGLIVRYVAGGQQVIQLAEFERHQPGLHRRTESQFPAAPESSVSVVTMPPLSASERKIEDFLVAEIRAGRLSFGREIVSLDRQVRIGQYYLDIVAKTAVGETIVIEVKRQRVTAAALEQVRGYARLISGHVEAVVIGHGLVAGLDINVSDVLIGTYDDSLVCQPVNESSCSRTFTHVHEIPSEENRTEEKRREPKGTALRERFDRFWEAYPKKVGKDAAWGEFQKRTPGDDLTDAMIDAVNQQRASEQWQKDGGQYIPNPRTWLHQGRWQDGPTARPRNLGPTYSSWGEECQEVHGGTCEKQWDHGMRMKTEKAAS